MKTGISTASLFGRFVTEDALKFLNDNKVGCAEVFLESFCEYNIDFGKKLNAVKGDVEIHSVHTLTTQFEPQLYSLNERAKRDSFLLLENTMCAAEELGAKYYTFHGGARYKKLPFSLDFDRIGRETQDVIDLCLKHGVSLAYENVHWGYYNYVGFFKELKKKTSGLKATFDIKQARLSGADYGDFIAEMGKDLVTVHISDVDENGKMCLPFSKRGITDFKDVFSRLRDVGFDGAILLEVYKNDFSDFSELFDSLYLTTDLSKKILG